MIVVDLKDGHTMVVRQTDHARMAKDILEAWQRPICLPESIWPLLLEAAEHHDDGWGLEDRNPQLDDDGRPIAFDTAMPVHHVGIWRRSVDIAGQRDPFVRLLICLHARSLYAQFNSEENRHELRFVQQFMDDLSVDIEELLRHCQIAGGDRALAVEPENLNVASRLLLFADGLSLWLLGAVKQLGHVGELTAGDTVSNMERSWQSTGVASLNPWPMHEPEVTLGIQTLKLVTGRFEDELAFKQALMDTAWEESQWQLVPQQH